MTCCEHVLTQHLCCLATPDIQGNQDLVEASAIFLSLDKPVHFFQPPPPPLSLLLSSLSPFLPLLPSPPLRPSVCVYMIYISAKDSGSINSSFQCSLTFWSKKWGKSIMIPPNCICNYKIRLVSTKKGCLLIQ